jgi:hypothetical protein
MKVQNLNEAYSSIYSPREIPEEVEIAAQYFNSVGLNEDGIEYVIEHLGLEDFANFVYDIAEEYYLTEARRGPNGTRVRIEPITAKGLPYKGGKPTKRGLKRLQDLKQTRKDSEEAASAAKPSGLKASLQRQSAIADASKRQPPRRGVLDTMAGAVLKGLDRHNAAMNKWTPVVKQLSRTGDILKKGLGTAAKAAFSEEVEEWVNALVEEGYDLSEYTWDDMAEIYMEELERLNEESLESGQDPSKSPDPKVRAKRELEIRRATAPRGAGVPTQSQGYGGLKDSTDLLGINRDGESISETLDIFDYILEYLIYEGYTDTVDDALVIMTNMSEEWKESICQEILDERNRGEQGMTDREVSRRRNLGGNTRFRVSSSSLGDHGSQGAIQKFHARKSKLRQAIHKSGRHLRGDTGEGGRYEANKDHKDGYPSIRGKDGPF